MNKKSDVNINKLISSFRFISLFSWLFFMALSSSGQVANDPKDIGGYGKTTWGMTPEEVLKAESRAKKLAKNIIYFGPQDTSFGIITIDSIKIDNDPFKVTFVFDKKNKLHFVNLDGENDSLGMCLNDNNFSSIEKLLAEKYGSPSFKKPHLENDMMRDEATWKFPKTTIKLNSICRHGGPFSYISIQYKPSIDESGDL